MNHFVSQPRTSKRILISKMVNRPLNQREHMCLVARQSIMRFDLKARTNDLSRANILRSTSLSSQDRRPFGARQRRMLPTIRKTLQASCGKCGEYDARSHGNESKLETYNAWVGENGAERSGARKREARFKCSAWTDPS